jgi:hypothetical protein
MSNLDKKVSELREHIRRRTEELGIQPEHDEEGHWYRYGDKKYASVTGRLQLLKDSGLANWKMNKALNHIKTNFHDFVATGPDDKALEQFLESARMVPQSEFTGAGDLGTRVHSWRERWFTRLLIDPNFGDYEIPANEDIRFISAVRAIKKFRQETSYQPVACELYVADHTLQTGGQVDDIGFVNGKLSLVDLKTSNIGDKEQYYAQVALYYYMFSKLYGIKPQKLYILHVSKTDGTYNLIEIPNINKTIKWAKKVVEVSLGLEEIKASKRKTPIFI